MSAWLQRVGLKESDQLFDGRDACRMRDALGDTAAPGSGMVTQSDTCSLREQALLGARLEAESVGEVERIFGAAGLRAFGCAGAAVLAAETLREAIATISRFAPLLNIKHSIRVLPRTGGTIVELRPFIEMEAELGAILVKMDVVKIKRFLADIFGSECNSVIPGCLESELRRSCPGRFDIYFPRLFPDTRSKISDRSKYRHDLADAIRKMDNMERRHLIENVKAMISGCLPRLASLEEIASRLGFSERTFRRRLAVSGTSYSRLQNELRRELACWHLKHQSSTVEQIAEITGYSESANFRHAFRRWTGTSPQAYRLDRLSAAAPQRAAMNV